MKNFIFGHHPSFLSWVILLSLVITFIRFIIYDKMHVDHHHETYTVVDVRNCYDGSITMCAVSVKHDTRNTIQDVELEFLVDNGDALYKRCYYRGIERNTRMCYPRLVENISGTRYQATYGEVK